LTNYGKCGIIHAAKRIFVRLINADETEELRADKREGSTRENVAVSTESRCEGL